MKRLTWKVYLISIVGAFYMIFGRRVGVCQLFERELVAVADERAHDNHSSSAFKIGFMALALSSSGLINYVLKRFSRRGIGD